MCGFGGYPLTPATIISNTLLVCTAPSHPVAETLPLRLSLNGQAVHPFPLSFAYMRLGWIVPSMGPTTGGTVLSLFGDNLAPLASGAANTSTVFTCRFGEILVEGVYEKKLDAVSVDPRTGSISHSVTLKALIHLQPQPLYQCKNKSLSHTYHVGI
jgi:hypothetical protein